MRWTKALPGAILLLGLGQPYLWARPEFLMRFANDPFSKPELRSTCATCHVNPAGGGRRNEFGHAFARNDFRITPEFRMQWPDHFLSIVSAEAPAPPATPAVGAVKATWSAGRENSVLIEIAGVQYLVNQNDGTIKKVDVQEAASFASPPKPGPEMPMTSSQAVRVGELPATLDYYLVNLPTNRARPPKSFQLRFSHRFSEPVAVGRGKLNTLFGLDSFSVSSFGIELGLLKHVSFVTYRSPNAHFFGGPTIELGPVFPLVQQSKKVPLSFSFRFTVEGEQSFTERFTTNLVPVVSHSFRDRVEIFTAPAFSLGVPRRTLTGDFPITPGERRDNLVSMGLGISIRFRPKSAVVAEWHPRLAGFRGFGTRNTFAVGIQRATERHVFALTFSNTQATTTTRTVTDGLDDLRIGFNIYRRLF